MTDDADAADRRAGEDAAITDARNAGFSRLHPLAAADDPNGQMYIRSVNGTDADMMVLIPASTQAFACRHRAAIGDAKPCVIEQTNGTIPEVVAEVLRWPDE